MRVQKVSGYVNFPALSPDDLYLTYIWEERRINEHHGWEIYPQAIYDVAKMIQNDYNNMPWFVSENRMGEEKIIKDSIVEDDYRIDFVKEHITHLYKAIEEGSNCFGYHMWTLVVYWSWLNAHKNRYGFYRVDLATQERMIKRSALWLKDFVVAQSK